MKIVWGRSSRGVRIGPGAVENGADALWIPSGMQSEVKKMGSYPTIAEDGDVV